ncbi:hypothetical protein PG984_015476 [Apiospora sp. TS-2023a]
MAILSNSNWEDLFRWIEGHSQWGRFPIESSQPLRPNQELRVWLHQLSPASEDTNVTSAQDARASRRIANGPEDDSAPAPQVAVERQFRCLGNVEMSKLEEKRHPHVWPPHRDYGLPQQYRQCCNTISSDLETAVGTLSTGRAPSYDSEMLSLPDYLIRDTWSNFKVPTTVVLDDEYRGDAIMYGWCSPALNLFNPEDKEDREMKWRVQHWRARSYMVYRDGFDMGAFVQLHRGGDHTWHRDTVEVTELQALIILLDRQTIYAPQKQKLRAWLVSGNDKRFRVLEAYLDQDVDVHALHVSILDERAWPVEGQQPRTNSYGDDLVWKWLLSWVFPQPLS